MSIFNRTIRLVLRLSGGVVGLTIAAAALFARYLISPPRTKLHATPTDIGLNYEDIHFLAQDGARLGGWFIPAQDGAKQKTILLVHGWTWNRLGTQSNTWFDNLIGATPLDFLRLIAALNKAGYAVFTVDLRNHGLSTAAPPTTLGLQESNDVIGALNYLEGRADVGSIGIVAFSSGANATLYALPHSDAAQAVVLVQPTSPRVFTTRFARDLLGSFGLPVLSLVEIAYRARYGLNFRVIEPLTAAPNATMPTLYIQGNKDNWGTLDNVANMVHVSPGAVQPAYVEASHRYHGYEYPIAHPEVLLDFFDQYLS